jgi:hypothetical protein
MPQQTEDRFELIDCGREMKDMTLAGEFDPAPGISANFAAAVASGDVLAMMSADAEPSGDWVASIGRFFAEQPKAKAVIGRTIFPRHSAWAAKNPAFQIAVRTDVVKSVDGFNAMRPPEADVLSELISRLTRHGVKIDFDDRIMVRTSPGISKLPGPATRVARRIACALRGGRYETFHSPLLSPISPMLVTGGDQQPVASVIVPIKPSHRCGLLALHALSRQDMDEPYEIVVCLPEGASLADEISVRYPHVRLCFCGPRAGPGGGRNVGISIARGEILAFTDADCLAGRTWLRSITAAVRTHNGGAVRGWRQIHHVWSAVERAMQLAEEGTSRPKCARLVPGINGANMGVSRRLLDQSGARFAEGSYGAEEAALLNGLPPANRTVLLDPSIPVRELRYETLQGAMGRMRHLGFGSGQLRRNTKLRGSFLARHLWLAPLLVPARLLLMARRLPGCSWGAAADFIRLSPLVAFFLIFYVAGFVSGAADQTSSGPHENGVPL